MLLDLLFRKSHFDQFSRNTTDNTVRRKGFSDNSTSSHHRTMPDGDTLQYRDIRTHPDIILDDDRLVIHIHTIHKLLLHGDIGDVLARDINAVVARDDRRMRTKQHLLANGARSLRTINDATLRDGRAIPHRQVPQALEVRGHRTDIYQLAPLYNTLNTAFGISFNYNPINCIT